MAHKEIAAAAARSGQEQELIDLHKAVTDFPELAVQFGVDIDDIPDLVTAEFRASLEGTRDVLPIRTLRSGEKAFSRIAKLRRHRPIAEEDLPAPLTTDISQIQFSPGVQAQQRFAQQIVPTFPQQGLQGFTSQGQGQFPGQFPGQAPGQAPAQFGGQAPAQAQGQQGKPGSFTKRGPPTVASSEQGVVSQSPQKGSRLGSKGGKTGATGTTTTSTTA